MDNYLITGGAGFIGSNFIRFLFKKYTDIHILCLDKLTYAGNIDNIKTELNNRNFTFIKGDINDSKVLKNIFSNYKINYVINFAAESHVDRSIDSPQVFLSTNILGTQNLLNAAKGQWEVSENKYGDNDKFIQISTDEVYGSCTKGKFKEYSPLDPHSPYAASKASADMVVKSYIDTYNFPALITRCSNNYGPYQFPEKLIPLMINNLMNGQRLPVYGKGENIRDWIYVLDHCEAVDLIANKGKIGEIYNIGGNSEKKNIDIVKLLISKVRQLLKEEPRYKKMAKARLEKINNELIEFVKDRPGHDFRYAMDTSKIEKLGWTHKINFDEGIKLTILWYLENTEWLKNIISGDYQEYYKKMYGAKRHD